MKRGKPAVVFFLIVTYICALCLSGCASYRTEMKGKYEGSTLTTPTDAAKVKIFFLINHLKQTHGLDVIPKLDHPTGVKFNDIFGNTINEIKNIDQYAFMTEAAFDVTDLKKRTEKSNNIKSHDFTIHIKITKSWSFPQYFIGGLLSTLTLTLLPMSYYTDYDFTVEVLDPNSRSLKTYKRQASVKSWLELFLIFVYAYHPEERVVEEIYTEAFRDIFRQIESDNILRKK